MSARAFSCTKLVVSDLDRAGRFYCDVIGMKLIERLTAGQGEFVQEELILSITGGRDANMLLLVRYLERPAPPAGAAWTVFIVADLDATMVAVEQAGGRTMVPAHQSPGHPVKAGIVADPDGHMIELVQILERS